MIAIVESILVITMVDRLVCQSTVEFKGFQVLFHSGHIWVNKDMLGKVTEHHKKSTDETREAQSVDSEYSMVVEAYSDD
jgi:hypothetical protein